MENMEAEGRSRNADPAEQVDWQNKMPKAKTQLIRAEIEESKGPVPNNKQRKKMKTRKNLNQAMKNENATVIVRESRNDSQMSSELLVS